jgi:hypothetical protein
MRSNCWRVTGWIGKRARPKCGRRGIRPPGSRCARADRGRASSARGMTLSQPHEGSGGLPRCSHRAFTLGSLHQYVSGIAANRGGHMTRLRQALRIGGVWRAQRGLAGSHGQPGEASLASCRSGDLSVDVFAVGEHSELLHWQFRNGALGQLADRGRHAGGRGRIELRPAPKLKDLNITRTAASRKISGRSSDKGGPDPGVCAGGRTGAACQLRGTFVGARTLNLRN